MVFNSYRLKGKQSSVVVVVRLYSCHQKLHFFFPGMVYMAGLVFAVGGFNGSLRVRTVDSYDPVKDQWSSVANMRDRRSTLGAAVLNGLLYAVGGFDGSTGSLLLILSTLLLQYSNHVFGHSMAKLGHI
jgi:hypothetical protein